jgi:hypothetical protein
MIAVLLCAAWAGAQVCTVEEAPEIRGLKLGMKRKEFLAKFPGTKPINMFNRQELSRVRGFSGLEMLAFRINNETLILDQLELRYAGLSGGIDRLTLRVGRELGLPQDAWKIDGDKAEMQCLKFGVKVDAEDNGFTITDTEGQKYWDRMREFSESSNK